MEEASPSQLNGCCESILMESFSCCKDEAISDFSLNSSRPKAKHALTAPTSKTHPQIANSRTSTFLLELSLSPP